VYNVNLPKIKAVVAWEVIFSTTCIKWSSRSCTKNWMKQSINIFFSPKRWRARNIYQDVVFWLRPWCRGPCVNGSSSGSRRRRRRLGDERVRRRCAKLPPPRPSAFCIANSRLLHRHIHMQNCCFGGGSRWDCIVGVVVTYSEQKVRIFFFFFRM